LKEIIVSLFIPAEEYQRLYQGAVKDVVTTSQDGLRVRFPAHILRPFVLRDGIRGRFLIRFTDENKFHSVQRL